MSKVIIKKLSKDEFKEKGIQKWQIWTCEASTFPWEYTDKESCYILGVMLMLSLKMETNYQ